MMISQFAGSASGGGTDMYENARTLVTPDLCSRAPVVSRDHVQCRPAVEGRLLSPWSLW